MRSCRLRSESRWRRIPKRRESAAIARGDGVEQKRRHETTSAGEVVARVDARKPQVEQTHTLVPEAVDHKHALDYLTADDPRSFATPCTGRSSEHDARTTTSPTVSPRRAPTARSRFAVRLRAIPLFDAVAQCADLFCQVEGGEVVARESRNHRACELYLVGGELGRRLGVMVGDEGDRVFVLSWPAPDRLRECRWNVVFNGSAACHPGEAVALLEFIDDAALRQAQVVGGLAPSLSMRTAAFLFVVRCGLRRSARLVVMRRGVPEVRRRTGGFGSALLRGACRWSRVRSSG